MKKTTPQKKQSTESVTPATKVAKTEKGLYTLTLNMGGIILSSEGNDSSIFSGIKPFKVNYKCEFTLENNETKKKYVAVFTPILGRKLLSAKAMQELQWKRMSAKVA